MKAFLSFSSIGNKKILNKIFFVIHIRVSEKMPSKPSDCIEMAKAQGLKGEGI
jgi:hypothetical protein